MRCEDVERRLEEREDGVLGEAEEGALDEHLLECSVCRETAEGNRAAGRAVRQAVDAEPVRAGFTGEVMARVRADVRRSRRRGAALIGAGTLTAAAAVLLVLVALRPIPEVRVLGTEGGLLRLDRGPWRSLGEGDRIGAGSWVLTLPGRRATLATDRARLLLHGDSLVRPGPERVEILRGRLLVTAGPGTCRLLTPWGEVEAADAVVAVTLRYDREPLFRVGSDGRPEPRGSLLLVAGLAAPEVAVGGVAVPRGHAEIVAIEGRVRWRDGEGEGILEPGQQILLGTVADAAPTARAEPGREPWMLEPLRRAGAGGPAVRRGDDAVRTLEEWLAAAAAEGRRGAAVALGRLCGDPAARKAAAKRLLVESDAAVLRALLDAIRRLGVEDPERLPSVARLMRHTDPSVREAALRCWLDLRGRRGIEAIGRMIDDPEPRLRLMALEGLRLLADPAARPWAKKATLDPDPAVVEAANRVLEAIEGR